MDSNDPMIWEYNYSWDDEENILHEWFQNKITKECIDEEDPRYNKIYNKRLKEMMFEQGEE